MIMKGFLWALVLLYVNHANAQYYPIGGVTTGINSTTKARPFRRNILDLQNDPVQFSLYIQALAAMQNTDESNGLSYFQLAGIHGRPYGPWDGVSQTLLAPNTGFCTHDSVLFATWHRPYLALFEQTLASCAQTIAKTYPSNLYATYQAGADALRIPYWDWGSTPQMPSIVSTPTVSITTPSGVQTVNNPLFQYNFQNVPLDPNQFPPGDSDGALASYNYTVRYPDSQGAGDDINTANYYLENAGLGGQVWQAIMKSANFNNFATMASAGSSIESPHGTVHVYIGGPYGHMSVLSYSAFDPIFWLHHTNVDRITALYQAISPNTFIAGLLDSYGTYTIVPNTIDTASTLLKPFAQTSSTFYTSNSVRSLSTFGYSYPEITDWNQTAAQLTSSVTAKVTALYNANGQNSKKLRRNGRWHSHTNTTGASISNETLREWTASVSVSKFDLDGQRFIVRIFCGAVPEDPKEWGLSKNLVGSVVILPPPGVNAADGRSARAHDEIVVLREDIVGGGYGAGDGGGDGQGTVEYLRNNLKWRVQLLNNTALPSTSATLPTLSIDVADELVSIPYDTTQLPVWGRKTPHPEIIVRGD